MSELDNMPSFLAPLMELAMAKYEKELALISEKLASDEALQQSLAEATEPVALEALLLKTFGDSSDSVVPFYLISLQDQGIRQPFTEYVADCQRNLAKPSGSV